MTLNLRPAKVRQLVAYMATAAAAEVGSPYPACDPGTTLSRWATEFQNGYNGVNHDHPYTEMWVDIQRWYKSEGLADLCDAEIADRAQAAMGVGFTTKSGTKISAKAVAEAVQTWAKNGWFRYEQRRDGRRKVAYKYAPIACVSVLSLCLGTWISPKV
jgi:hypothetical protein